MVTKPMKQGVNNMFKFIGFLIVLAASIGYFVAPITLVLMTINGGILGFFAAIGINLTCYAIVAMER